VIAKVSGILANKQPGEVIVDVGGVGYQIFISLGDFYRLPESGRPVNLYIHTHLTEETIQLFGFLESSEKQVFLLLNAVAGIGPKLAMNILSGIPAEDLTRALREEDQPRLISIPGEKARRAHDRGIAGQTPCLALCGGGWSGSGFRADTGCHVSFAESRLSARRDGKDSEASCNGRGGTFGKCAEGGLTEVEPVREQSGWRKIHDRSPQEERMKI
jgi:hypothetical protein